MNKTEVAEIRRNFKPGRPCCTRVHGCYVTELGNIASQFNQSFAMMNEDESVLILNTLKKALGGKIGVNLLNLEFPTNHVMHNDEYRFLAKLRDEHLGSEEHIRSLYEKIIAAVELDSDYMILMVHNRYDVPTKRKDNEERDDDASDEVFSYILCAICPVTDTKPALSYKTPENELGNRTMDKLLTKGPVCGFMFPAFDDRTTNLYGAEFYTKDPSEKHEGLIKAVFGVAAPEAAASQKHTFHTIVKETFDSEYDYETAVAVQNQIQGILAAHKEAKVKSVPELSCEDAKSLLKRCKATKDQLQTFQEKYEEAFGADGKVSLSAISDNQRVLATESVVVRISTEGEGQVHTEVRNGKKFIMIEVDDTYGVELNGIALSV